MRKTQAFLAERLHFVPTSLIQILEVLDELRVVAEETSGVEVFQHGSLDRTPAAVVDEQGPWTSLPEQSKSEFKRANLLGAVDHHEILRLNLGKQEFSGIPKEGVHVGALLEIVLGEGHIGGMRVPFDADDLRVGEGSAEQVGAHPCSAAGFKEALGYVGPGGREDEQDFREEDALGFVGGLSGDGFEDAGQLAGVFQELLASDRESVGCLRIHNLREDAPGVPPFDG